MFKKIKHKISLFHWNIGFIEDVDLLFAMGDLASENVGEFSCDKKNALSKEQKRFNVSWMQHNCRDRFFADPFILDYNDEIIEVLVEEFFYSEWRGMISLLTVDRKTYRLLDRKCLLDLPTHLSFPFIWRENGETFVMPENCESGELAIYKYDSKMKALNDKRILIDEPLVDPVLYSSSRKYYIIATKDGESSNSDLYVYIAEEFNGKYRQISSNPVKSDIRSTRPAGSVFEYKGEKYRFGQNCEQSYGAGVTLNRIDSLSGEVFQETEMFEIMGSQINEYREGFHTVNVYKDLCVVDGLTYIFRPVAKFKRILSSRLR